MRRLPDTGTDAAFGSADGSCLDDGLPRVFSRTVDGHEMALSALGITFRVSRLRRRFDELVGELAVTTEMAGARTHNGVLLSVADLNLSSLRARQDRAKHLAERSRARDIDWLRLLDEFIHHVLIAEREGDGSLVLRDVTIAANIDSESYDVLGLAFPRAHPWVLFGDGGSAKSFLMLKVAAELTKRGLRVGLFDWEMDEFVHRRRLEMIAGQEMPEGIRYIRCAKPLVHEGERLFKIVRQDSLDYGIFDSVAYGCNGAPESAEAAMEYFRTLRGLGIGAGLVAHITKSGDQSEQSPFGSRFWSNSARDTWFLKRASASPDGRTLQLAAFHRKANLGRQRPATGIEVQFSEDQRRLTFRRVDAADIAEVAGALPTWQRVRSALRAGPLTIHEIATEIEAKADTVKKALTRGDMFTLIPKTPDGVQRWALTEQRAS